MYENLFKNIDVDLKNTNLPCGSAPDAQAECDRYNALLETKKQDVQVLGLGSNGHIGFNEPGTSLDSVTHLVDLTENTIKDNSRLFNSIDEVPRQALSMGIKNIMQAKSILMVVSGKNKAEAVRGMVKGEITPEEARAILTAAPGVTVVDDPANKVYPMPVDATEKYDVLAGRIRQDISRNDKKGIEMFVSGDQLLKGAALNAVQIAELL